MREASSVVLYRDRNSAGPEIFLVERSAELRFFGGFVAFPGGAVDRDDRADDAGEESVFRACAVREVLEEVSVELDPSSLVPAARFVTPLFSPVRFDTRFYFARLGESVEPRAVPGELSGGSWWHPEQALAAWRRRELRLTPPALVFVRLLNELGLEPAIDALRAIPRDFEGSGQVIPWEPGYEILPLHCAPLPPTLPANSFFVGWRDFYVVDPGPTAESEREHLLRALESRIASGDRLRGVLLTHHHIDHVAALDWLLERVPTEVLAHRITAELLERKVDREIDDGDWIELGDDPTGRSGWGLRCIFTPGHAAGHVSFHDERFSALIAGDLVSTLVSMYVGSPGGHLGTYFASVERLRGLGLDVVYPSHGVPTHDVASLLERTITHRRERLDEIAEKIPRSGVSVGELAETVYGEIDERFREFYVRATRASLEYLAECGQAVDLGSDRFGRV